MNTACVFCIDDAYVMPFQVFFHSLEATSSLPTDTPIFILHTTGLSGASIITLQDFLGRYGRTASFMDATDLIPSDLPIRPDDHVSPATFYRLFVAEILPSEIEQVVYLDADMLALRSIADLFTQPVNELVAAADHLSPGDQLRLWGERGGSYFQAGVLVIPLRLWREQGIMKRFLQVMADERHRIQWWDQDVLNIALRDRWKRLPIWCNVCEAVHRALPLSQIEAQASLIHYSGSSKPWNAYNPSPFTKYWDKGFAAAYGHPFDREALRPSPRSRLMFAIRSRLSGLIHGRR